MDFVAWWQLKSNWDIAAPGGSVSPCLCVADTNGVIRSLQGLGMAGHSHRDTTSAGSHASPLHSLMPSRAHGRSGFSSADDDQHHSAGKCQYADDRGQGNPLLPVDRGLERSKVNDFLTRRVRDALVGQGEHAEDYQGDTDQSRRFQSALPPCLVRDTIDNRRSDSPGRLRILGGRLMAGSSAMIARGLATPRVMVCWLLVPGESLPALPGEPR